MVQTVLLLVYMGHQILSWKSNHFYYRHLSYVKVATDSIANCFLVSVLQCIKCCTVPNTAVPSSVRVCVWGCIFFFACSSFSLNPPRVVVPLYYVMNSLSRRTVGQPSAVVFQDGRISNVYVPLRNGAPSVPPPPPPPLVPTHDEHVPGPPATLHERRTILKVPLFVL